MPWQPGEPVMSWGASGAASLVGEGGIVLLCPALGEPRNPVCSFRCLNTRPAPTHYSEPSGGSAR